MLLSLPKVVLDKDSSYAVFYHQLRMPNSFSFSSMDKNGSTLKEIMRTFLLSFRPQPVLVNGNHVWDPVQKVGHSGVDTILVFIGTSFAPAHHTRQKPGLLVACHQRPTAVTFTSVLATAPEPSAKHVLGDVELCVEAALLQGHPGQLQPL